MRGISSIVVLFVVLAMFVGTVQLGFGSEISNSREVLNRLQSDFPGVMVSQEEGRITRLYGKPMGFGSSPINTAEQFKINYGQAFGVNGEDLKAESFLLDGRQTQPVMYDRETGEYKFTLVYYSQHQDNIPVFRADLRLLVLNQSGYPLVLASSALRDLGDFSVSNTAINYSLAENAARMFSNDLRVVNQPRLVVWAGINDMEVQPSTAMEIIADNGMPATSEYEKWLLLVDVNNGEILYSENMIIDIDIEGNVSGMATLGKAADICEEEGILGMPHIGVYIEGENPVYADENGDFIIPFAGGDMVNVISELEGQWFRVQNQGGSNARIPRTVIPPGPVNFIHNEENTEEFERAEVNGYYHANKVRDFTLTYNPDYPGLQQTQFPVNVNLDDNCNAYYDYSSINFFTSGGGCPNTAFSTIIHHEYGHHLVAMAGSGQGQYGEGMSDVMGVLIMDDPGLAYGFFSNCEEPLRNADNGIQYPCTGAIHYCGQLISGCVWDTRIALEVTYPDTYIDIISNLAVNAMLLHTGDMITPDVTIDYLTL
ncbi:MAG: M4 family metallopeptidase, partial [candidate division Zixibacteria bacterium]|nr:M4 family metallopeptidase [candidate division Zixibacteria bacterium]